MPLQAKKIASTQHTEKSTKVKKKKKKDSAKTTTRKNSHSGSDSTTEGHNKKSSSKVIAFGRTCVSSDTGSYPRSSSQEPDLTSSCRASSTDGRSTSSSGENLEAPSTSSSSDIDCTRGGEERDQSKTNFMIAKILNESLRWEGELDNIGEEEDRMRVYKINRRKRYMARSQTNEDDVHSQFYA